MDEDLKGFIVFFLALFMTAAAFACSIKYAVKCIECNNYEKITGRNTEYVFFGGCFIQTENGWLTKGEYAQSIIAREGLSKE